MIEMRKVLIGCLVVILMTSCSKKTLDFVIQAPTDNKAPASYTFINKSEGFDTYWWDFGDEELISDSVASHKYLLSGSYDVTLKGLKGTKVKELTRSVAVVAPEKCLVLIETELGNMMVQLFDETPVHRDNFIKLAESGYYDGLLFHRVINGFMLQGGDPESRGAAPNQSLGTGGPGYTLDAEIRPNIGHIKGALAAARQGDAVNPEKKSSGSQFYIVDGKGVSEAQLTQNELRYEIKYPEGVKNLYLRDGGTPFLDQQYTVFGQVIEGLDVIDAIASTPTNRGDRPRTDVSMKITVIK